MTSFMFEGPAVGGPANGRLIVSYSEVFASLYPVTRNRQSVENSKNVVPLTSFAVYRYRAHEYGRHKFFLPAQDTLERFLVRWKPPVEQMYWPVFLSHAIEVLSKETMHV